MRNMHIEIHAHSSQIQVTKFSGRLLSLRSRPAGIGFRKFVVEGIMQRKGL